MTQKKKTKPEKKVSLHPLEFEDAMKHLMDVDVKKSNKGKKDINKE